MIRKFLTWLKRLLFGSYFTSGFRPVIKKGKPYKATAEQRIVENKIRKNMFQARLKRRRKRNKVAQQTMDNQIDRGIYKHAQT